VHTFRHNDPEALERILAANRHLHKRALVAVEGLYSMDGDTDHLPKLVELKEKFDAWLMVDEAHAPRRAGVRGTRQRRALWHRSQPGRYLDGHAEARHWLRAAATSPA